MWKAILVFLVVFSSTSCSNSTLTSDAPIPDPTPSQVPNLIGTVPNGWQVITVPGTATTFAIPADWETTDVLPGLVSFDAPLRSDSTSDGYGHVAFVEAVPTSRLSLLQLMQGNNSTCRSIAQSYGLSVRLLSEKQVTDSPMYLAEYKLTDDPEWFCYEGGIVTSKGTIIVAYLPFDEAGRGWAQDIAKTVSYPAPVIAVQED